MLVNECGKMVVEYQDQKLIMRRDIQLLSLLYCEDGVGVFHGYNSLLKRYVLLHVYKWKHLHQHELKIECKFLEVLKQLAGVNIERGVCVILAQESGVAVMKDLIESKENKIRESEALRILAELVEQCIEIHENGIALGELRIEDIWVGGEGKNQIRVATGARILWTKGNDEVAGGLIGTVEYMCPEMFECYYLSLNDDQISKREINLKLMDVYSVGVVLMKLLKFDSEDIIKLKQFDTNKYKENERNELKKAVWDKYLEDYKFLIENVLVNIIERQKYRHSFADLRIYLDKIKPLYRDVKLNFSIEIDKIGKQTLEEKLSKNSYFSKIFNKQQREIKYLRKIGKFYKNILHKSDKAIQYFEKVMKLEEQIYGITSSQMIKTYELMVQLHSQFGLEHNVQALSLAEQLEQIQDNQALFLRVFKYKALIHFKLGNYELCMQCFQDYVENVKQNQGEFSEQYFESQIELGKMYRTLREQEQAIFTHQTCLTKIIELLKDAELQEPTNFQILKRKSSYELILDFVEFDMHEKAGYQLNELITETEAIFGEKNYETMHLVNLKVWTLLPQKDLREQARSLCEKNLINSIKACGSDSFLTSECYYYMSEVFSSLQNPVKSLDMANKSLKQRMRIPPETSYWVIKSLIQCGKLEIKFGNLARGIGVLEKSIKLAQTAYGDQSYYYCQCNLYLGQGKRMQGKYEESSDLLETALQILPKTAASLYFCALLHLQLSLTLKALRDYQRCKQLSEHSITNFIQNQSSAIYFETLECLSEAQLHIGEKQQGLEGYQKILEIRENELKSGDQKQREEVIRLLILVATMISKSKDKEEKEKAISMLQKALNLSLKGKTEKNSEVMQILQLISMVYDGLGDKKKAKEYRSKVDKMKKEIGQKIK